MKGASQSIEIVPWSRPIEATALPLLYQYEETSLFLLSNLKTYGPALTSDTYSGNFKCLVKNGRVMAVFDLTKAGNLLVQTDRKDNYAEIIIDECRREPIVFK